MTVIVNAVDVELRIRALARTYPDRVYDSLVDDVVRVCVYRPNARNPLGCIVGAAAGPLGADLGRWDHVGAINPAGPAGQDERISGPTGWISTVQHSQDNGATWARAVALADKQRGKRQ